ncbi:Probable esterase KAI2 [Striga hermonthica]|uniref:Probable esterase KAI2 n=1 Tax=Striga hermonthica TaxID=68872 RepID=A0A9N7RJM3_STRHE|nr:Probable esterase KAI2 [Striga hermonthica]
MSSPNIYYSLADRSSPATSSYSTSWSPAVRTFGCLVLPFVGPLIEDRIRVLNEEASKVDDLETRVALAEVEVFNAKEATAARAEEASRARVELDAERKAWAEEKRALEEKSALEKSKIFGKCVVDLARLTARVNELHAQVDAPNSEVVQEFKRGISRARPEILLNNARLIFGLDLRPYLSRVTVPCHIIQSFKDMLVPVAVAEYIHSHLGGKSVVEVMPTEGHLPHLSSPELTNVVLLRHIRRDIVDE